ncbi:hypothetical protein J3F83DRAFT_408055 [Trichoderma novae-zelandiae]
MTDGVDSGAVILAGDRAAPPTAAEAPTDTSEQDHGQAMVGEGTWRDGRDGSVRRRGRGRGKMSCVLVPEKRREEARRGDAKAIEANDQVRTYVGTVLCLSWAYSQRRLGRAHRCEFGESAPSSVPHTPLEGPRRWKSKRGITNCDNKQRPALTSDREPTRAEPGEVRVYRHGTAQHSTVWAAVCSGLMDVARLQTAGRKSVMSLALLGAG